MPRLDQFGVTIDWQGATIPAITAVAAEADAHGFGYFWIPEAWGLEALSTAGYLLEATKKIRIGTGVLNVYSRSAALIGMSCATLDQIAAGRFMLGLGTSGRALVEDWHGMRFEKSLARTKEYVEVIRKVVKGETVDYDGQTLKLKRFRLFTKPIASSLEILLGAIGEKNLELAGEVADGAIVVHYPLSALKEAVKLVGKKIFAWYPLNIAESKEEEEKARFRIGRNIAFYVVSMGKYYARNLSRLGYSEDVARIKNAHAVSGSKGAAAAVSDEVFEELAFVGSAESVREKIERRIPEGVLPVFGFSVATVEECSDAVKSLRLISSVIEA